MRSCPYSHPNNLMHNIVRRSLKQSSLIRRAALYFDDLLYGRIPVRAEIPEWMKISSDAAGSGVKAEITTKA
jgi:hypothetical protein